MHLWMRLDSRFNITCIFFSYFTHFFSMLLLLLIENVFFSASIGFRLMTLSISCVCHLIKFRYCLPIKGTVTFHCSNAIEWIFFSSLLPFYLTTNLIHMLFCAKCTYCTLLRCFNCYSQHFQCFLRKFIEQ